MHLVADFGAGIRKWPQIIALALSKDRLKTIFSNELVVQIFPQNCKKTFY